MKIDNTSKRPCQITSSCGAVTFLDVLGWKGIWKQDILAINKLEDLIAKIRDKATELENIYSEKLKKDNKFNKDDTLSILRGKISDADIRKNIITRIEILSISDTIVLLSPGNPELTLSMHAKLTSWVLSEALKEGLPLRGAISYGEYSYSNNIMLGYAVDEAASWHESTDWIGVILSPSAQIAKKDLDITNIIKYNRIPFKQSMRNLKYCIDWKFDNAEGELENIILAKGPHIPEVAPKYLNTLEFLERDNCSSGK